MQAARQDVMMTDAGTAACATRTGIWCDGICDPTASTKAVRS
jgi:hypothetical protein